MYVVQGAFRMRGIGQGQTVTMLLTPEVQSLVERTISDGKTENQKEQRRILCDIATWLFVNSVKSERVQVRMTLALLQSQ